jgi:hypothetical protein
VLCIFMVRSVLLCFVQTSHLSPWGTSSVEADWGIVYGGDCPLRCVAVAMCSCSCRGGWPSGDVFCRTVPSVWAQVETL